MRLLDHLTIADASPAALIVAAARAGFDGVGLFLRSMVELPAMPAFDLIADRAARDACRRIARDTGTAIAIAYPFSIGRATGDGDHDAALDAAAELGAKAVNLLIYDRESDRHVVATSRLCEQARARGLAVGLEFFPLSAIATLDAALDLVARVAAPNLALTLDLLHVARSNASLDRITRHRDLIGLAQLCDAPRVVAADRFAEASAGRLLPGKGDFDIAGFVAACGPAARYSIEAPGALAAGTVAARARLAYDALDRALAPLPIRRTA